MTNKIVIGRTLDGKGNPIEESGIELQAEGPTAQLLQGSKTPLISNPITGEYLAVLEISDAIGDEYLKGLVIMLKKASGPPEHYHPNYLEEFEVVEGEFIFLHKGKEINLKPGEKIIVNAGETHAFHTSGKYDVNSFIGIARTPRQLKGVIFTLFGLAHEGKSSKKGGPQFWQAMAMASELGEDTVFVSPPPVIQKVMGAVFGPVAKWLGHRAIHPEKLENSYWMNKVEQFITTEK
jgi:quercetin dioxygenase-like cupin family protein